MVLFLSSIAGRSRHCIGFMWTTYAIAGAIGPIVMGKGLRCHRLVSNGPVSPSVVHTGCRFYDAFPGKVSSCTDHRGACLGRITGFRWRLISQVGRSLRAA